MRKFMAVLAVVALVAFAAPALAANPFMDVPMNHWAYDAIGQLAASGIVNGYPDGTFKGNQPMTRYEMATLVARALAVVDMNKASKQDVEMLKKLVVEFKDELDALGVKVDQIDKRVAVLEENIGGWKIWGQFRLDAKFAGERDLYGDEYVLAGKSEFDLNRYRLWLRKTIDENTSLTIRLGRGSRANGFSNMQPGVRWERFYVETMLPWDVKMTVGQWLYDWEDESGLYIDEDAWFTDAIVKGFYFTKTLGMADLAFFVGHEERDTTVNGVAVPGGNDRFVGGLRANFNFNENFRFAVNGLAFLLDDDDAAITTDFDKKVYWADFGVNFTPAIAFKGAYFMEDLDRPMAGAVEDSPNAWKAIIDVKQEAFGFTSLWLEYAKLGEGFWFYNNNNGYDVWAWDAFGASNLINRNINQDTTVLFAYLSQKWNDKWTTFQRYFTADFDTTGVDDTTNWTFGVKYQYSPAMSFELAYDNVDWGSNNAAGYRSGDDHIVRFRTLVNF
jgi:hypothetical protein